jgi:hypothetical protein
MAAATASAARMEEILIAIVVVGRYDCWCWTTCHTGSNLSSSSPLCL